jgi:DHA2 family multidrug resistance protein
MVRLRASRYQSMREEARNERDRQTQPAEAGPRRCIMTAVADGQRGLITAGLMTATFLGMLDSTVVNVSLPHIQGSLSASSEQITWVLTFYMVATAVMTPISSWLAARVGLRPMLLTCVGAFTLTSMVCGVATNLPEMIVLRVLQGMAFAPIPPLAQAVLLRINPPERFGRAMAAFTMATVAAPVIGPALGGFITEHASWRWCFYINLPAGIVAFLLLWAVLPDEPAEPRRFDFLGFGSLAMAIGALQLLLDRGPSLDWFGSREICAEALVAVGGLWVYVTHTITAAHPLFDPSLIRNRNFVAGAVILFVVMLLLFASVALLPLMTQTLLGYPATLSGLLNVPRALVILVFLQLVGRLDTKVDRRLLAAIGLVFLLVAFWRMSFFDLSMGAATIIFATLFQGVGQGLVGVPVTTLTLATIRPDQRNDASTVINLIRSLGGSVGVSLMAGLMVANGQKMHASLAAHVNPDDPVFRAALPAALSPDTLPGISALNAEITRQSAMVAFVDNFRLMIVLGLACLPLLLLLRQPRASSAV